MDIIAWALQLRVHDVLLDNIVLMAQTMSLQLTVQLESTVPLDKLHAHHVTLVITVRVQRQYAVFAWLVSIVTTLQTAQMTVEMENTALEEW
jgi:hypothetical protein